MRPFFRRRAPGKEPLDEDHEEPEAVSAEPTPAPEPEAAPPEPKKGAPRPARGPKEAKERAAAEPGAAPASHDASDLAKRPEAPVPSSAPEAKAGPAPAPSGPPPPLPEAEAGASPPTLRIRTPSARCFICGSDMDGTWCPKCRMVWNE